MDKDMDILQRKNNRLVIQILALKYELKKTKDKLEKAEAHRALISQQLKSWGGR